ncbi:DUF2442 domain-containing protein [Marinibaculum pumilum]|uniref:DUF2442 domain-containing protein n=1 Tax=Marinibaculum pumilum TaxID=1766165 RepID=A0ABV7KX07_9PROT
MGFEETEFETSKARMQAQRESGYAVSACYDEERKRIVVVLATGVEICVAPSLLEGLAGATVEDLAQIEVSPAGLGLHWPRLDADVYVPSLLQGVLGSESWMASQLGSAGGRSRSPAKAAASRANGRKGGRPRGKGVTGG